jgi:transposase
MTVTAATSTAVSLAFPKRVLIPAPHVRPARGPHRDGQPRPAPGRRGARRPSACRSRGLAHRYPPAYSPDLNPIEPAWSKLKARLRAVTPRPIETLEGAIPDALNAITAADARAWSHHRGYRST